MKIKWFGQSCSAIISDNGTRIVIDPFDKRIGYPLPELEADIVTTSHDHSDHNNVSIVGGEFKHLNKQGRYIENGIVITSILYLVSVTTKSCTPGGFEGMLVDWVV